MVSGATNTIAKVSENWIMLLMTMMRPPQLAGQRFHAVGIMGPKNGMAACARCGRTKVPVVKMSARRAVRERMGLIIARAAGAARAFPTAPLLLRFSGRAYSLMVERR